MNFKPPESLYPVIWGFAINQILKIMEIKDIKFKSELQTELRRWMKKKTGGMWHTYVYAEINGKPMHLSEYEARFLQNVCADYCTSDEKFNDWCERIVIYDGQFKRRSKPMEWCADGTFSTKFQSGFYDTAALLHLCLLRKLRNK